MRLLVAFSLTLVSASLLCGSTRADEVVAAPTPYALPWQLRSVMPATALRVDSAIATYKNQSAKSGGTAIASLLTGSYKLRQDVAVLTRVGLVHNEPPNGAPAATSFVNPLFGGLYSKPLSEKFRLGLFFGLTAPVGSGGGNYPNSSVQAANSAGLLARSAMDNALFAVNYFTVIPGVDLAYIVDGWTVQLEATLLQLTRVRGEQIDKDKSRLNMTSGLAVGYALQPWLFAETEVRYQKWLTHPTVFGARNAAVENLTFAVGPRFNFKIGSLALKPGVAYVQGLVGAVKQTDLAYPSNSYKTVFLDIPISF